MPGIERLHAQACRTQVNPPQKPKQYDGEWIEMQEIKKESVVKTYRGFFLGLDKSESCRSTETLELGKDKSVTQIYQDNLLHTGLNSFDRDLLKDDNFWNVVAQNADVTKAFEKLLHRSADTHQIEEWVQSNPFMTHEARLFMLVLLFAYEAEIAKQVALANANSRASLETHWVSTQRFIGKLIGFRDSDEEMTGIMGVELFRDRVLNVLKAHLNRDAANAHRMLVSTAKDTLTSYANADDKLLQELKKMNVANLQDRDKDRLLFLNEKMLEQTNHQIAYDTLPKLNETDFGGKINPGVRANRLIVLRGIYVGHYLSDEDLKFMRVALKDNEQVMKTLEKKIWGKRERSEVKKALLGLSQDANRSTLAILAQVIFKLHAPQH